ncbi:hypothetical protein SAMN04488087_0011 [Rhodothermus profundi]|uniref:Uncharacterized protein n=2 Tax=Rhodothermus profundi TaxID=633813 RepID=A0A1M6P353_9BACT|nr:hypothetical protein SAMN04488087_0011 [Rhodothermus profundi]
MKFMYYFSLALLLTGVRCRSHAPWLSWGEGGGFTGAQHGYTVYTNGTVEAWAQRPGQARHLQRRWKLNASQQQFLETVYQQLQGLPAYTSPANYTRFIVLYASRDTLRWAWGVADTHATARALQTLYETLNQKLQRP